MVKKEDPKNSYILIAFIVVFIFVLIICSVQFDKNYGPRSVLEQFMNIGLGSKSGFGFQEQSLDRALFVNFYPNELGTDFRLSSLLRKLKMYNQGPTLTNANQLPRYLVSGPVNSGVYNGISQVTKGAPRIPIIIVPTIGASKIYGRWSKLGSDYVKKLDAYGNFETSTQWKCRDVQDNWEKLWFPEGTQGLVEYCWSSLMKTDTSSGYVNNQQGLSTAVNDMGQLDFGSDSYNVLIKALNAIGYVNGQTLFGANYDFRKVTTDLLSFTRELKGLIDSKGPCIIIGHGFGACLANAFLNSIDNAWKQRNIVSLLSISGTFGGCPKALRVLMSGEGPNAVSNRQESKIIRNTTLNYDSLSLMLPNPSIFGDTVLVSQNMKKFSAHEIPELLKRVNSNVPSGILGDFTMKMLKAPEVPVYIMAGTGLNTESGYVYSDLLDSPQQTLKGYVGDGTVPDMSLRYPLEWSKYQKQDVNFKFYENAEHAQILSMYEPVSSILKLLCSKNGLNYEI